MVSSGKSVTTRGIADQTPLTQGPRDELGLNRPNSEMRPGIVGGEIGDDVSVSATSFATSLGGQSMSIREMARAERRAMKRARKELGIALANLPEPQFEYELAAPETVTDDDERDDSRMVIEKDAADIEAEEIARLEKEAAKLYEERSSVVKRVELPRPIGVVTGNMVLDQTEPKEGNDTEEVAQDLIREEMLNLLQHDAYVFPVLASSEGDNDKKKKKDKKKMKSKPASISAVPGPPEKPLEHISEETFDAAEALLNAEEEVVIQEKRRLATDLVGSFQSDEEMKQALSIETVKCSLASDPVQLDSSEQTMDSLEAEYNALVEGAKEIRKQADKLESKLSIKNGGYVKRCNTLNETAFQSFAEIQNSKIEESVYSNLMAHEERGITNRIEKLQEEIEELETSEAQLQKQYGDLLHERNRHKILIRQQEEKATA